MSFSIKMPRGEAICVIMLKIIQNLDNLTVRGDSGVFYFDNYVSFSTTSHKNLLISYDYSLGSDLLDILS